jgi:hypothetical protein
LLRWILITRIRPKSSSQLPHAIEFAETLPQDLVKPVTAGLQNGKDRTRLTLAKSQGIAEKVKKTGRGHTRFWPRPDYISRN